MEKISKTHILLCAFSDLSFIYKSFYDIICVINIGEENNEKNNIFFG